MGNSTISRRDFFRTLSIKKETVSDDPLFDKYSRKTLGPRVYRNELISYNNDGGESLQTSALRVGNVLTGLAPYTGSFGTNEAIHLLNRTGWGFKKTNVDTL
ncbi:MAG: hypothetical protein LH615_08800, partial [Ferruginibacter sp.]|nr:hypothetical protein [Ferruginibacter sp.]